jgi:hypothetical protein
LWLESGAITFALERRIFRVANSSAFMAEELLPFRAPRPGGFMSRPALHARALTCAALLSAIACLHSQPNGGDVAAASTGSKDLITQEEIASVQAQTAYDIIKKRRANFLSYRGETSLYNTSSPEPTVYVDDQMYGPLSILASIPAQQVASIRLYRAWEATTRYGTGNMGGVIAVYTRR